MSEPSELDAASEGGAGPSEVGGGHGPEAVEVSGGEDRGDQVRLEAEGDVPEVGPVREVQPDGESGVRDVPEQVQGQDDAPVKSKGGRPKKKDWSLIPVPEWPWGDHGWAPRELGDLREAAELPYHPNEPLGRAAARRLLDKNPKEFWIQRNRLEAELRAKVDKSLEEEAKAAKEQEAKTESAAATEVVDLGSDKVRDLGLQLLGQWELEKKGYAEKHGVTL